MTPKEIERKILALRIDMAGESTNEEFLAMCDRYLFLRELQEIDKAYEDK